MKGCLTRGAPRLRLLFFVSAVPETKLRGKGAFHALVIMDKASCISVNMMVAAAVPILEPQTSKAESCWASGETELGLSMKVDRNPVIGTLSLVHKFCSLKPNLSFQNSKAVFWLYILDVD